MRRDACRSSPSTGITTPKPTAPWRRTWPSTCSRSACRSGRSEAILWSSENPTERNRPLRTVTEPEPMQVILASPRGFCAGVDRAIEIVERALALYGPPVYVLHEIVHNRHVLDDFRGRGVRFVEDLAEIPEGSVTIFSAHGVAGEIEARGRARNLRVIDATCPLVTKVHLQAQRYERDEREIVLVGHPGHPAVEGTRGRTAGP